jgi:uracil-DNA glycosylase
MAYDSNCNNCPYEKQIHLSSKNRTNRVSPPIELENNNSEILLLFQAPGTEEWKEGQAIQPVKKQGGTAGRRIELSWERKHKNRNDFDIINTVQCFPGNNGNRDLEPNTMSICSCSNKLEYILNTNHYSKIIAFGEIAQNVVENITNKLKIEIDIVKSKHPTGGLSNKDLDDLW